MRLLFRSCLIHCVDIGANDNETANETRLTGVPKLHEWKLSGLNTELLAVGCH